ncbi:MAG: hypothetical protein AAF196_10435 [Planctomycetota bacterium]
MTESTTIPSEGPETLQFEGILEGRTVDSEAIRIAANDMSRASGQTFEVEFDGPMFSILSSDGIHEGANFDESHRTDFLDAIRRVIAAAEPNSVESTLRCSAWFGNQVAETVFAVQGGEPQPVGRMRPRGPNEGRLVRPEPVFRADSMSRARIVSLVIAAVIAVSGLVYFSGVPQRIFAQDATELDISTGPLQSTIAMSAESEWNWNSFGFIYEVKIRAGEAFPATPMDLEEAIAGASDHIERAALETLQSGGRFEIQLLDKNDKVLFKETTNLVQLLSDPEKTVTVELTGHFGGARVRLALETDE